MFDHTRDEPSTRPSLNPYVFIGGCPRSGTTLLQRILNAHPQLAITPETQWIPQYFKKRIGLTAEGLVTPELMVHLANQPRFTALKIDPHELAHWIGAGEPLSYARLVTGIFDLYGRAQGKRLVGDKTPGYVRKFRILHPLWPQAKFVHLIRDGRDTCLSALQWTRKAARLASLFPTWSTDPVTTAALWWEWHVRVGREAKEELGPRLYYELRYEALVTQPASEVARLCAFLGVPYDAAMLRFHEGRTRNTPGLSAKHAWRPITSGLRDWRGQMPAEDVERFEAAAGALLDELGYPRGVRHPRPEAVRQAVRVRALFPHDPCSAQAALSEP
jgi:hypothetical protein